MAFEGAGMTLLDAGLRSDHARTAYFDNGPSGLMSFRSDVSPSCTLADAGRYADLLTHVAGRLDLESPAEGALVWETAEDLAYRGWDRDGEALYDWSLVLSRLPGM